MIQKKKYVIHSSTLPFFGFISLICYSASRAGEFVIWVAMFEAEERLHGLQPKGTMGVECQRELAR